jgi:hypothetical protein
MRRPILDQGAGLDARGMHPPEWQRHPDRRRLRSRPRCSPGTRHRAPAAVETASGGSMQLGVEGTPGYFVLNVGSAVIVWLPLFSFASTSPPISVPGSRICPGMSTLVALPSNSNSTERLSWSTITM